MNPTKVVYGPGTFLNRAVAAVNTEINTMMAGVTTVVQDRRGAGPTGWPRPAG